MGPRSRESICNVLGHLIDELQLQRSTLETLPQRISSSVLQKVAEDQESDLKKMNERLAKLERFFRGGPKPSPA